MTQVANPIAKLLYKQLLTFTRNKNYVSCMTVNTSHNKPWIVDPGDYTSPFSDGPTVIPTPLSFPVHSPLHVKAAIKTIFALNRRTDTQEGIDRQIDYGFEALRFATEIVNKCDLTIQLREENKDRANVKYYIGQVVQHKKDKFRGVIKSWSKDSKLPEYSGLGSIYYVIPDKFDKMSLVNSNSSSVIANRKYQQAKRDFNAENGISAEKSDSAIFVLEDDLEVVDVPFRQINNENVDLFFDKYDASTGMFQPSKQLAFTYPSDQPSEETIDLNDPTSQSYKKSKEVSRNLQKLTTRINLHATKMMEIAIVSEFFAQIDNLNEDESATAALSDGGDVPNDKHFLRNLAAAAGSPTVFVNDSNVSVNKSETSLLINKVVDISILLEDIVSSRFRMKDYLTSLNHETFEPNVVKFPLGSVVRHKKFGFRGIVASFDAKPRMDVKHWDGLDEIDSPETKPFYYVHPDINDSYEAFGGYRYSRYVVEDNLEFVTDEDEKKIQPMMSGDQSFTYNAETNSYVPSSGLEIKNMISDSTNAKLISIIEKLHQEFCTFFSEIRTNHYSEGGDDVIPALFSLLQNADKVNESRSAEDMLRMIWSVHENHDVQGKMREGNDFINRGEMEEALDLFTEMVEGQPSFLGAYARKATVEHLLGRFDDALKTVDALIQLENKHFGAINGKALGLMHQNKNKEALGTFVELLEINPWSSGTNAVLLQNRIRKIKAVEKVKEEAVEVVKMKNAKIKADAAKVEEKEEVV